jgi:hypothetical protein
MGEEIWGLLGFAFAYISDIIVEGACVRDCRGLGGVQLVQ